MGAIFGLLPVLGLLSLPLGIIGLVLAIMSFTTNHSTAMSVIGLLLSLLAIALFAIQAFVWAGSNDRTATHGGGPSASSDNEQAFKSVKIAKCGINALDLPVVEGTVVNTSEHKATVRIGFDITDGVGTRIDAAQGQAEDLAPGQRGRFTTVVLAKQVRPHTKITCTLADVQID
ncbi:FxLYD domain-containing protein [Nonomuraea sp. NPDC050663]|uniref:FxLYD domain-containing protein n=1 Tax=Nonomuraea sp. NPDC050663 TaxID=3364370 RepID=UPI0037899E49